ncbi:Lrp/AsnC family transcriptional regulator [Ignisphaera sp. 4213-co]|uniref:Lrp/AsnC family transcriptional regulator n=1 Tax=Ignisphaera cupida TaxID=3050454 RepID=A0ABD4Z4Z9_9CREN|nr:Lrp/AsnC family transcriptional regulator [Ignisphaera sp. 4213-co]MDK6028391.1 Lrp/AsnC family transcriptional regulator [Ignisphaera sp. 4213-co]
MTEELDEKDKKLIEKLSENARATYTELAKELGLSDVAVIKRVKKLEGRIIKRYTIVVDPRNLGFRVVSITGIDVDPDKLFNVIEVIKNKEYIRGLWLTTGDHPLMSIIWARDEVEMAKIHKELANIDGVKRVCPAIVLKTVKELDKGFYID